MATPVSKITPTYETIFDALTGILQYVPDDDDDEL